MSSTPSLTPNPYFDPNPTWLYVILKVWCIAGVLTTIFGYYLVIFKSPAYNTAIYKKALLYHLFIAVVFQLHYTILTPPLIYLPYTAMGFWGIWSALGMDADIQVSLLIGLIIMTVSVVIPFLYYRMDCLLPQYHPLKSQCFRYFVYCISYGLSHALPMPLLVCACRYTARNEVKKYYEDTYHIYLEGFWKKEIATAVIHGNPYATAFVVLVVIVVCLMITISFGCTIVIYQTVKGNEGTVSEQMKRDRKRMLASLVILMIIVTSVAVVVAPIILYTLLTGSLRCDIFNIMVACAGGLVPTFIAVYIASYKPYRDGFIRIFKNMRIHASSKNTTVVVPTPSNNKY